VSSRGTVISRLIRACSWEACRATHLPDRVRRVAPPREVIGDGQVLQRLRSPRLVIEPRWWVSKPLAFAGKLRPRRLNNQPFLTHQPGALPRPQHLVLRAQVHRVPAREDARAGWRADGEVVVAAQADALADQLLWFSEAAAASIASRQCNRAVGGVSNPAMPSTWRAWNGR
jgi:hypothetical protein